MEREPTLSSALMRDRILACCEEVFSGGGKQGRVPELWDGKAAERIVEVVNKWVAGRG